MKIINLLDNQTKKIDLYLDDKGSVSIVEENKTESDNEINIKYKHFNIMSKEIQRIKYSAKSSTESKSGSPLGIAFSIIMLVTGIIMTAISTGKIIGLLVFGFVLIILGIILFIISIIYKSSDESKDHSLIFEDADGETIWSKQIELSKEKITEIIDSIREQQTIEK